LEYKKKLIEVALPLDAINRESTREKSIRHGHPSTLHLWWSRKPLATCRAVLFAQLVDDPSSHTDKFPAEEEQEAERQRLFRIIEELVKWENINNEEVLEAAREEIWKSTGGNPPLVLDPFCGGGSIPLEAQRLGLEAHGRDLNPVAVLITKALIEIPPKFKDMPPVHPVEDDQQQLAQTWWGAQGLAEDIRYYGKWMRDEAEKRIGHLHPDVELPEERGGGKAKVIAWLWARTVPSPNPAINSIRVPLLTTFWLSKRKGHEVWLEPCIDRQTGTYSFAVRTGRPPRQMRKSVDSGTRVGRSAQFRCLLSDAVITADYIDEQASTGHMDHHLLAIVVEGDQGRAFLSPTELNSKRTSHPADDCIPRALLTEPCRGTFASNAQGRRYGFRVFDDYFTPRQLAVLSTFIGVLDEVCEKVVKDMQQTDQGPIDAYTDPSGDLSYAEAIKTYLALALDKLADRGSSLCSWDSSRDNIRNTFARQAIAMTWEYAEGNPFSDSTGSFLGAVDWIARVVDKLPAAPNGVGCLVDATGATNHLADALVCTDPPYYDNIVYSDLSDFFYVLLRQSLRRTYPALFETLLTPKSRELVADRYRFDGDRSVARRFFETGLEQVFGNMGCTQDSSYPLTLFYAFKQTENAETSGPSSTGWSAMRQALLDAGFQVTATWPIRTELGNRILARGANTLASSILLSCRVRPDDAPLTTKRDLVRQLRKELSSAIAQMQRSNIAPVDLAQAIIGPGMRVFSRYSRVLEADGSSVDVEGALDMINRVLDECLSTREGEYDADTRWALAWFEQYGFDEGPFGVAETLSKAKNTAVSGLVDAGILVTGGGKVRLLEVGELDQHWDPTDDERITVWEVTHHLVTALLENGEEAAALLLSRLGALGEVARDFAYRLYNICERKKWSNEALAYNTLITSWPEISRLAAQGEDQNPRQQDLFEERPS